jgi:hypothetical protein
VDHLLVQEIEKVFGWSGPADLGRSFARGTFSDPALAPRLLTPGRFVDLVMRRSLSPPQFRCLQAGQDLHPRAFMETTHTRRGQAIPMVDMDKLGHLIESGVTAVLDSTNTFDPTMEVACRALQWWSGELVKVNTYLTTADAAGFELHWDDHDVLVVQVAGSKSWQVRGASRVAPMFRDAEPTTEPPGEILWSGTMNAGDVMHIPRGFWHQATRTDRPVSEAGQGFSLHVTFGLEQRTGIDWTAWLADQARARADFRHDLAAAPDHAALIEALAKLAETHTPQDFLASRRQTQRAPRHRSTWQSFGAVDRVACITEFRPEITSADDGTVTVSAAGRRIRFAGKALRALEILLSGRPVVVGEVTRQTGVNAATIAQMLLQENVCGEVGADLSSGYTGLVTGG